MSQLRLILAQINTLVGDIPGNTALVLEAAHTALAQGAVDLLLFPELTLTGYPPDDLLLRPSLALRIERALQQLLAAKLPVALVIGYPRLIDGCL